MRLILQSSIKRSLTVGNVTTVIIPAQPPAHPAASLARPAFRPRQLQADKLQKSDALFGIADSSCNNTALSKHAAHVSAAPASAARGSGPQALRPARTCLSATTAAQPAQRALAHRQPPHPAVDSACAAAPLARTHSSPRRPPDVAAPMRAAWRRPNSRARWAAPHRHRKNLLI